MIRGSIKALLFFSLSVLAYWALFGIFNDNVVVFKFLNFAGQVIPYVSLIILLLLFWFLKQIKWRVVAVLLALPSLAIPFYIINLSLYKEAQIENHSNNTQSFSFITFSKMSHNTNYAEIAKVIDCEKYDVINVQEIVDLEALLRANPQIKKECNIQVDSYHSPLVVFSKFPLSKYKAQSGDIVGIHISGNDIVYLINVRGPKAISQSFERQVALVRNLIKSASALNAPIVVAGDFNATQFNQAIYQMKSNFHVAKSDSGLSLNPATWPGESRRLGIFGPWIQIDYIFYKGLNSASTFVHSNSYGSDHYPVETEFSFALEAQ